MALLLICFALLLWLGLYMIRRDVRHVRLRLAGLSLAAYALGIGAAILRLFTEGTTGGETVTVCQDLFLVLSCIGTLLLLKGSRKILMLPVLLYICSAILTVVNTSGTWSPWLAVGGTLSLMAAGLTILITAIKEQGESWLPDLFRSFDYTAFFTLLFAGQVVFVIWWGVGLNMASTAIMLTSIAISIVAQVFFDFIRAVLDRIAFWRRYSECGKRSPSNDKRNTQRRPEPSIPFY